MRNGQLQKLIEAIVAEVARRVAEAQRQEQHPEQVLLLLPGPIAYAKELKELLHTQFGEGYTPLSFSEDCPLPHCIYAGQMSPTELLQQVTQAKTVILVAPPLELLQKISEGQDKELLSHLMVRSILWRKDVRLYLDFEPPRFRRNTFLEGVASAIDTLHDMGVMVHPYYTGDAAKVMGESLVTEADVLAAAQRADKTISCRAGAIITPAARDALAVCDVTIHYEGECLCN